jgi:isochorismate synthase
MPALTIQDQVTQRLTPLLRSAADRADRLRRPVLASYTGHLGPAGDFDPAALVAETDAFVWQQPDRGFAMAAAGHAVRFTATGRERFDLVRRDLVALLDDAVTFQESGAALRAAPVCVGGFAFDPQRPDDVAWFGYPDALLALPRVMFTLAGSHLFLTVNALVDAASDQAAEAEALAALARRLAADACSGAPEAAGARLLDPGAEARELWADSVFAITSQIAGGLPDKAVLARRVGVEAPDAFDARAVLARLRERFRECTVFAVRAGEACFVGATPETLVSLHGDRVRADCLAGTARRGKTPAEDERLGAALLADEKERREHAIVARGITQALAGIAGEVQAPEAPVLRRMANLQHLHTPIEARTEEPRHVLELVERLHPTAATAGLPKEPALCLIREQKPFSRGWYAGPVGWVDAEGGGEFAVALRSGLLRDDVATLYAGCGIVQGSQPEREWAESEIKLEAMLWALNASHD